MILSIQSANDIYLGEGRGQKKLIKEKGGWGFENYSLTLRVNKYLVRFINSFPIDTVDLRIDLVLFLSWIFE
jgi:hypothetical protein